MLMYVLCNGKPFSLLFAVLKSKNRVANAQTPKPSTVIGRHGYRQPIANPVWYNGTPRDLHSIEITFAIPTNKNAETMTSCTQKHQPSIR